MRYCPQCGGALRRRVPPGDHRRRDVCTSCGRVHYRNPVVVVGCIVEWQGRVLLGRRAMAPRAGYWTFPCGYMERGETTEQAVLREVAEETHARVELSALFSVFDVPRMGQVYVVYRGHMQDEHVEASPEMSEVRLFDADAIPWRRMAYPVIGRVLSRYLHEQRAGRFGVYAGSLKGGKVLSVEGKATDYGRYSADIGDDVDAAMRPRRRTTTGVNRS